MATTTFIDNQTVIYAAWLNDVNNAVYNGIFVSPSITATSMICNGTASGAGFTNLINNTFSAPGAIGSATPNTGAFTTLSATTFSASSISSLTTPLSRANGGTGLSAAGTSGFVLTSNGTNWTSALNPTIGVGQTWQDMSASRTSGVTYTNSTSKPIMVNIGENTNSGATLLVDGVQVAQSSIVGGDATMSAIVPVGSTYVATYGGLVFWAELR